MIFYFSGTGNTKWAASLLAKRTDDELVNMAEAGNVEKSYNLKDGERIGFCFPVHGWRPPKLVRDFIRKMNISDANGHYCYAVCTAGDNIGETMDLLKKDLKEKGIGLDSAFSLIMPESYVGLPFMDVDTPEKEKNKKDKAAEDLNRFAETIINRKKGEELEIGRWPKINSRVIGGFFISRLITDKPFRVTADRCIKCGKCASVCPVNNIVMGDKAMPEWKHDGSCLTCFACYHYCPEHAIEFGRRTKNKGQYYYK